MHGTGCNLSKVQMRRPFFNMIFAGNLIGLSNSFQSKQYVLDEVTNLVFQKATNGNQLSVLTGRSIDQHFGIIRPNGQVEYGLVDAIDSTILTVDRNGNSLGQFQYEPFGETISNGSDYPFQFAGRMPIAKKLYQFRARNYDPLSARFISEDPLGFLQSSNLYRYVNNNPVNFLDPTGNSPERPDKSDCDRLVAKCIKDCCGLWGLLCFSKVKALKCSEKCAGECDGLPDPPPPERPPDEEEPPKEDPCKIFPFGEGCPQEGCV